MIARTNTYQPQSCSEIDPWSDFIFLAILQRVSYGIGTGITREILHNCLMFHFMDNNLIEIAMFVCGLNVHACLLR